MLRNPKVVAALTVKLLAFLQGLTYRCPALKPRLPSCPLIAQRSLLGHLKKCVNDVIIIPLTEQKLLSLEEIRKVMELLVTMVFDAPVETKMRPQYMIQHEWALKIYLSFIYTCAQRGEPLQSEAVRHICMFMSVAQHSYYNHLLISRVLICVRS